MSWLLAALVVGAALLGLLLGWAIPRMFPYDDDEER
jgi:hypothetical protein